MKVIATNLDGFLIKGEAFERPHQEWFEMFAEKTGNHEIKKKWMNEKNYFPGVLEYMKLFLECDITIESDKKAAIDFARTTYQQLVASYIAEHSGVVFEKGKEFLQKLKNEGSRIILITTNTNAFLSQIIKNAGLEGIFDAKYATDTWEVPEKEDVFKLAIRSEGREPDVYIGGSSKSTFELCKKLGIRTVYCSWDGFDEAVAQSADKTVSDVSEIEI